jgi:hypothetical protein
MQNYAVIIVKVSTCDGHGAPRAGVLAESSSRHANVLTRTVYWP